MTYLLLRMSCAFKDFRLVKERGSAKLQHLLERKRLDVLKSILQQMQRVQANVLDRRHSSICFMISTQVSVPSQLSSHRTVLLAVSLLVGLHSRQTAASIAHLVNTSQHYDVFDLSKSVRTAMFAAVT